MQLSPSGDSSDHGLARHLDLLEARADTPVVVNGQRGKLDVPEHLAAL